MPHLDRRMGRQLRPTESDSLNLIMRPATLEDALGLSSRLRLEDVRELDAASGLEPIQALTLSLLHSRECYAIRLKFWQDAIALFGVSDDPHHPGFGVVWLVSSPEITDGALALIKEAPHWFRSWRRFYAEGLHNLVDVRNTLHLRWLSFLGFALREKVSLNGYPFLHAIRRYSHDV